MFRKGSIGRKIIIAGSALGVCVLGGGYATYQRRLRENRSVTAEDFNSRQDANRLQWALDHLTNTKEFSDIKLFRYTTCPWCGTVQSFMDCNNIKHENVEVEPMLKSEIAKSEYKKVPQLRFDHNGQEGPYLVDSKIIVDTMAERLGYGDQLRDAEICKWRDWARGPLVRFVTLEFNCSLLAAWKGYSYIDKCDTIPYANKLFLKLVGAPVMYLVAMKVTKPRLIRDGLMKPDDSPQKRLREELDRFTTEALVNPKTGKPRKFHGGSKPDLVDMDTFGVLQSVRGHRVYNEIITETKLAPWLKEMDAVTGNAEYQP